MLVASHPFQEPVLAPLNNPLEHGFCTIANQNLLDSYGLCRAGLCHGHNPNSSMRLDNTRIKLQLQTKPKTHTGSRHERPTWVDFKVKRMVENAKKKKRIKGDSPCELDKGSLIPRNLPGHLLKENNILKMLSIEEALSVLDQGILLPSIEDFILTLQKCRNKQNPAYAKRVHTHICDHGLEAHRAVGNYIVPMFVECGNAFDAQQVFERLVYHNEHSWTSLILACTECGQSKYALKLYQRMQIDGSHPGSHTFMALMKACTMLKDIESGRKVHRDIKQLGFEKNQYVGNALVDMYAKCGLFLEARAVFDELPVRDVVSWSALIAGYAEHGQWQEALKCFKQMQSNGISPDAVAFINVLKACGSIDDVYNLCKLHMEIKRSGFERNLNVASTLVSMYSRCGFLEEAQKVFDKLSFHDVVSWNSLITGCVENGLGHRALVSFEQMRLEGLSPDAITFTCVLKACGITGSLDKGRELHKEILRKGLARHLQVGSTLVDMYAKCGSFVEAREVFENLILRDVVSYTALIAGYSEHGHVREAVQCFEQMQKAGISPNVVTYISILKACGSIGAIGKGRQVHTMIRQSGIDTEPLVGNALVDMYATCASLAEAEEVFDKLPVRDVRSWKALLSGYVENGLGGAALKCFEQMVLQNVSPDVPTLTCVLKACGNIGAIDEGRDIRMIIEKQGLVKDLHVGSSLITMFVKCGAVIDAQDVFNNMPNRNVVLWSALIAGYAEHGSRQKALQCFEQMQIEGVSPNEITFACVLSACGNIGAIDKGRELHRKVSECGFQEDLYIGNTLVDMYFKCGSFIEAQKVFDNLAVRDTISWSAMIKGYGTNNKCDMALQCFEDMQQQMVKPNGITFTSLLSACSHANLLVEGHDFFNLMIDKYSITPSIKHYTCMVFLLAQSGYLCEAEKFLETTVCSPSEETWVALLSACKIYGEVELGVKCFKQLLHMNVKDASPYILMANIYANAGRLDDAYKIELLRKHNKVKKKPALALIEVGLKVHEFMVVDNRSSQMSMLEILCSRLKEEGHVPELDLVLRPISDEQKEIALCGHAEKQAIAFGLLNTAPGQSLRITKNLRMCNDCHNVSKIVSRIERREIIVRDTHCVHHFQDGLCSCGDML